jgi:hypothetical protein
MRLHLHQLLAVVIERMLYSWVQRKRRTSGTALSFPIFSSILGTRCLSDPLVSYGRHFCRTVHALCNVHALITNGLLRMGELAGEPEESFTSE